MKCAAALETKSSHPVAAAIVNHFSGCITDKISEFGSNIDLPEVTKFKNESGMGLSGVVDEKRVLVGNLDLMKLYNVEIKDTCEDCKIAACEECLFEWSENGCTVIFISVDERVNIFIFHLGRGERIVKELS